MTPEMRKRLEGLKLKYQIAIRKLTLKMDITHEIHVNNRTLEQTATLFDDWRVKDELNKHLQAIEVLLYPIQAEESMVEFYERRLHVHSLPLWVADDNHN